MDNTTLAAIYSALIRVIDLYTWVLIARILLSWFPVNWYDQPFKLLRDVTDPVMEPFRRLIPPLGMIDISPIVLFFLLNLVTNGLEALCENTTGINCPIGF